MTERASTIDPDEVEKFDRLAAEWWNPHSKFRPLHKFNPVRLGYIRDQAVAQFGRDPDASRPLEGLRLLDIGCGGGLLSEPMARLGAAVVGADPARANIAAARVHAEGGGLAIDYRETTAEKLSDGGETFDIVLAMEVVEHVASVPAFLAATTRMVRPGGLMIVATINRTFKAFALAIVGAEYVLRWLPRGTHAYDKLVTPDELRPELVAGGLDIADETGIVFDPLRDAWRRSADTDVNYMIAAVRHRHHG